MRDQIKLYHWQTKSFSRHKATDSLVEELDKHIDMFVEVYMGKYGRPKLSSRTNTIKLSNLSETSIQTFIKRCISYLIKELPKDLNSTDSDLLNIRDEMLAQLNQLQYLFTLK